MEVSFFTRRKILRHTNALDLIPVRLMEVEQREEGLLNILLPRFKRTWLRNFMTPFTKKEASIRIKLDGFGSAVWLMIDGKKTVSEIADDLVQKFPGELNPAAETPERVNKFMSVLYQQRFISFQQLQKSYGSM